MNIETGSAAYSLIADFGVIVNRELLGDFNRIPRPVIDEEELKRDLRGELTDEGIRQALSSCMNIALEVTQQCNFRCSYCTYSGWYADDRTHSNQRMEIETAKNAVDLFFQTVMYKRRPSRERRLYIGFYGGECLLEFELVKATVEYAEAEAKRTGVARAFDLQFRLNSNGYLLDDDTVVDFLAAKNVMLDVSFDGPQAEHDKFRVTARGGSTWERIMVNMRRIKERHPAYYDERLKYLVTLHPHHDGRAIDAFFAADPVLFGEEKLSMNRVNRFGMNPDEIRRMEADEGTPSHLEFRRYCEAFDAKISYKARNTHTRFTVTCFPGGVKLFVSADGSLNACEKMAVDAPKLGDVFSGFDFHVVRDMVRAYNEEVIRNRCWECDVWIFCDECLAKAFRGGGCRFNCSAKENIPPFLKNYLEKKEKEDEKTNDYHYADVTAFMDSL